MIVINGIRIDMDNGGIHFHSDTKSDLNNNAMPTKYVRPTPKICKLSRSLLSILLIVRLVNLLLLCFGFSLYIGSLSQSVCGFIIDLLILLSAVFSINMPFKRLYFLPLAAFLLIACIYGTNLFSYTADTEFKEFASPKGENTIVIRQSGYLYSGETKFYKKRPLLLKDTGEQIERYDYYQEITNAKIEVNWKDENTAVFSYFNSDTNELLLEKTITV